MNTVKMNTKQLHYVLVLAAEGSFSKAADVLGITQPSLSQYLKKIEKELNVTLFYRFGSEIRLTDAGRAYVNAGRKILDIERQLEGELSDINDDRSGTLIIGISPHRALFLMPEIIKRFNKIHPGICVLVEERSGHDLIDGAERGEFDLCVTTAPVDSQIFCSQTIMSEEVVLAVPKQFQWKGITVSGRKHPAVDVTVLNNAPLITLSDTQLMQQLLDRQSAEFSINYKVSVVCRSIGAQLAMVSEGLGIALVPSSMSGYKNDRVQFYSILQEFPHREIVVVYRKIQYLSNPMKTFIHILKEYGTE